MDDQEWLAQGFEANRAHLRAVAYRMLGSPSEADDAVQEAWLRLSRSDTGGIENLGGWLTTVVARVCLNMLSARSSRREEPLGVHLPDPAAGPEDGIDPEQEALLADSVGPALLVVLDALTPAERLAFVLHDLFAVPFDEIAAILGRSPAATRQLASRARRRVQGSAPDPAADRRRQRAVVDAFLAASRGGDFEALVALLDPDVVLRADHAAAQSGAAGELRGAQAVAGTFSGRARFARPALVDGAAGAVWAPGGRPRVVFGFTIAAGRIVEIELLADPERVRQVDLEILG
jgi:RNA polymerase sigma factor (sigma-70 family)